MQSSSLACSGAPTSAGERLPELPETETIARDLDRELRGRRILDVAVRRADVLREVTPQELRRRLRGTDVVRVWRRAKLVVLDLGNTERLVVQPRFTGALRLSPIPPDASHVSTLDLSLDDGYRLQSR